MKPTQIAKTMQHLFKIKQPAMVWGAPGAGKSKVIAAAAEQYGGEFLDVRLPLMDAVDLRGIPVVKGDKTVWMTPEEFPRTGKGVIFLDEIVQAIPIVQSAASSLILDRRIGQYTLPPGWVVCAAGNRETDRAGTNRMPSHIANRFTHLDFEVDANDWIDWAFDNELNPMVIGFIGFRPELLHKFDPKQRVNPTCRTWEFVSDILLEGGDLDECLHEVVAGTVGAAAATEFVGFMRVFREMPTYEEIVDKPTKISIPKNVAARYAVSTMLSGRTEQSDMKSVMQYVGRMDKEFQILTAQEMTGRNKRLAETSAYITWAAQNKDLLLNATTR